MDRFKIISLSAGRQREMKLEKLPKTIGVYAFFTKKLYPKPYTLNPIYIGKAINIQSRVKNHFQGKSWWEKTLLRQKGFRGQVGYFETNNSEIEALILEANLIKKYQPKYNVVWKDGKNYFYVAFSQNNQKIPYTFITHQPKADRLPMSIQFIGPFVEGTALKKTLRFLRRVFPYYTGPKGYPKHPQNKCTYCHLDLCPGPELFENPPSPEASARLREYRRNIKKLILILKGKKNAVLNSLKKEMRQLSKENKFEEAGKTRDKIYNLQQVMSHTHIINADNLNNSQILHSSATAKLRRILSLKNISRIECYDVSNIQGKLATGSMVVFVNGKPDKNEYRKFKIRLPEKPNDIAMLKEILQRRFLHEEWKYPEVILIDGGKTQLNIALSVRSSIQGSKIKNIKVMAVAKGRQELFIENKKEPIPLKQLPQEVYNLIKQLDDEAHRFAISYHKALRKKNLLQ